MSSQEHTKTVNLDTPVPKSAGQLTARIDARRDRIAANVDELVGRVHPKALAAGVANKCRDTFFTEDGDPRIERLAAVGVVLIGLGGVGFRAATHGSRKARKLEAKSAKSAAKGARKTAARDAAKSAGKATEAQTRRS